MILATFTFCLRRYIHTEYYYYYEIPSCHISHYMGVEFENFPFYIKNSFVQDFGYNFSNWSTSSVFWKHILQERKKKGNTSYIVEANQDKLNS